MCNHRVADQPRLYMKAREVFLHANYDWDRIDLTKPIHLQVKQLISSNLKAHLDHGHMDVDAIGENPLL